MFGSLPDDKATTTTLSEAQKEALCKIIIYGTLEVMEQTVKRESPTDCAAHDSNKYNQSRTRITDNILSISLLFDNLPLPSSARDFRRTLPDEENKIGKVQLSDVLSSLTRRQLLESTKNLPSYPRGRPSSEPSFDDERRGRGPYYEEAQIKQIIDEILSDPQCYSKIDRIITNSEVYLEHRAYSIEAKLRQLKEYGEGAFLTTLKPIIKKNDFNHIEGTDSPSIKPTDIDDYAIKRMSKDLALNAKSTDKEKKAIYVAGGIKFLREIVRKKD